MKRLLISTLLALSPLTAIASDHDFNAAVSSIQRQYHVHRQHALLMGALIGTVSVCARFSTSGAVKGLRIAEFDEGSKLPDDADMPALLTHALGSSWSLVVDSRSRSEQDVIFARPQGDRMRLLVASYDEGSLSVVRVDLNANQLAEWIRRPQSHPPASQTN